MHQSRETPSTPDQAWSICTDAAEGNMRDSLAFSAPTVAAAVSPAPPVAAR